MEKIDQNTTTDWKNLINCIWKKISVSNIETNWIKWFRKAFWDKVKIVLEEQKKIKRNDWNTEINYYDSFNQTLNWDILINPEFEIVDWQLRIMSEIWYYETYHAYNWLKNWFWNQKIDFKNNVNYKVLSAWVVMYNKSEKTFYLFKRPDDSQEAPGEIDILGWCMNTRDWAIDWFINPQKYVSIKIKHKAWLDINEEELEFMWVQEFSARGFYNLVYIYFLNDNEVSILNNKSNLSKITKYTVEKYMKQDNPGGAWLTLAMEYIEKNEE